MRNLILILGDQLDPDSAAFDGFDPAIDALWMAEVDEELTHVWCHKLRIAFFLSAMRHFRNEQAATKTVHYQELRPCTSFRSVLLESIPRLQPERLIVVKPGDYRVKSALMQTALDLRIPLEFRSDRHFYCSPQEFGAYAEGKKLLLENFYHYMRRKHRILLDKSGRPVGGSWNYDKQNRQPIKNSLIEELHPLTFAPDVITRGVIQLVEQRFHTHPGSLKHFDLPVTRTAALQMLQHFITKHLAFFGPFQDAMSIGQPFLFHSRVSALLNVKLLNPRECVEAAVAAYQNKTAPLNSVEGYVRQILGWREFVHGIYWLKMPAYIESNALGHEHPVPKFFWTGETDMRCAHEAMQSLLNHGYTHHIQRLMVLGLFALLYGVHPRRFHEWHMAMYIDAIDWVSLPNALGMSQFGDGGIIGTKPYCASGNYIDRMSNYCSNCRYNPKQATGENACPFTTLYYDFLNRHEPILRANSRLKYQLINLDHKRRSAGEMDQIRAKAQSLIQDLTGATLNV